MTVLRSAPDFANLSGLTAQDQHHWGPVPPVVDWLQRSILPDATVLEIGPGRYPFARSTTFVDVAVLPEAKAPVINVNINDELLPFPDKSFDFVYCRHTLEDMWNPFNAVREMARVGKAGYIETPSPMAELCRGVDGQCSGGEFDAKHPPWRGYYHHQFVVWEHDGCLCFVRKYPLVETYAVSGVEDCLRSGPGYWNTYFAWENEIHTRHWHMPVDIDLNGYTHLLHDALEQSEVSTNKFFRHLKEYYQNLAAQSEAA